MTAPRDPDRLIHHFLLEGEELLQDQVYDAVRAEIEQQRQRAIFGPWRMPIMKKFVSIGLGAAAVVVLLFLGSQLLASPSNVGSGGEPTPTPEATVAEPTARPTPTPRPIVIDDPLVGQITVTVPGSGWDLDDGILVAPDNDTGMFVFSGDQFVYGDPCRWSTTKPDNPATTVDEIVAALGSQASRDASEPVDLTVAGHAGKAITLHVPDDAVFSGCDDDKFGLLTTPDELEPPGRYNQGPGQIDEFWVVDANGVPVVFDLVYWPDTPQDIVDDMHAIVESATFGE